MVIGGEKMAQPSMMMFAVIIKASMPAIAAARKLNE
jgi:hypothetical protein